jgi:hypothetical protein
MTDGMPAMLAALRVVDIASNITEAQVKQALDHVSQSGATYGILWGFPPDTVRSLELLEYLGEIVTQLSKLKKDKRYPLVLIAAKVKQANEDVEVAYLPRGSIFRRPKA